MQKTVRKTSSKLYQRKNQGLQAEIKTDSKFEFQSALQCASLGAIYTYSIVYAKLHTTLRTTADYCDLSLGNSKRVLDLVLAVVFCVQFWVIVRYKVLI